MSDERLLCWIALHGSIISVQRHNFQSTNNKSFVSCISLVTYHSQIHLPDFVVSIPFTWPEKATITNHCISRNDQIHSREKTEKKNPASTIDRRKQRSKPFMIKHTKVMFMANRIPENFSSFHIWAPCHMVTEHGTFSSHVFWSRIVCLVLASCSDPCRCTVRECFEWERKVSSVLKWNKTVMKPFVESFALKWQQWRGWEQEGKIPLKSLLLYGSFALCCAYIVIVTRCQKQILSTQPHHGSMNKLVSWNPSALSAPLSVTRLSIILWSVRSYVADDSTGRSVLLTSTFDCILPTRPCICLWLVISSTVKTKQEARPWHNKLTFPEAEFLLPSTEQKQVTFNVRSMARWSLALPLVRRREEVFLSGLKIYN